MPATALSLGGFQNELVELLLKKLSVPGSFEVKSERVDNSGVGAVRLSGVTVADSQGVWFRAASIQFAWSSTRLLKGEAVVEHLRLINARVERAPIVSASTSATAEQPSSSTRQSTDWPRAPLPLEVANITIENMYIAPAVLAGGLTFNATGALRDKGNTQSLTLNVKRADAVRGNIDLGYLKRFDTGDLDLRLGIQEGAGGLAAKTLGLPGDVPVKLGINAAGPPSGLAGGLRFDVAGLLSGEGKLRTSWSSRISAALTLGLRTGKRLDSRFAKALGTNPSLELKILEDENGGIEVQRGVLDGGAVQASATGHYNRVSGAANLRVTATVASASAYRMDGLLTPLSIKGGRFDLVLSGARDNLKLTGYGEAQAPKLDEFSAHSSTFDFELRQTPGRPNDSAPHWALKLKALVAKPRGRSSAVADALGSEVQLTIRASGAPDQIRLAEMRLRANELSADLFGDIDITPAGLAPALRYKFQSDLGALAKIAKVDAYGRASGRGAITTVDGAATVKGNLSIANTVAVGRRLGNVRLSHTTRLREIIDGSFDLQIANKQHRPARATGNYRIADRETLLSNFKLRAYGVRASGRVALPQNGTFPRADFVVAAKDLSRLGRALEIPIKGRVDGSVKTKANSGGSATATLELSAFNLDGLSAASAVLQLELVELKRKPRLRLSAKADSVKSGALQLAKFAAKANGPVSKIAVELRTQGRLGDQPLAANSALQLETLRDNSRVVTISKLSANFAGEEIHLKAPARVLMGTNSTSTQTALRIQLPQGGLVAINGAITDSAARGTLTAERVPLALARLFAEVPIASGTIDASAKLDTNAQAPRLDLRVNANNVRVDGVPADAGELSAVIEATWQGQELQAKGLIKGPFKTPLSATVTLPLTLPDGPFPAVLQNAPVTASVDWRGDIAPVYALLPLPDHLLSGTALVAVRARGTLERLRLSGDLELQSGRYEHLVSGTIINNLVLQTSFDENRAVRFELRGDDGSKGQFHATGLVRQPDVQSAKGQASLARTAINIEAKLRDALIVRSDAAVVRANATLGVHGETLNQLQVKGHIDVTRAELRLVDPGIGNVADIGPVVNVDAPAPQTDERRASEAPSAKLDIAIGMPQEVFVRGRGLSSEWGGDLLIRGTAAQPQISGRIEARRGTFDLVGKTFKLVRGRVVFDGAEGVDPALDIRLERTAEDIVGAIILGGRASGPELGFAATPAVPEDEVLPRILFGRSRQSLSASEALQLASAAQTLASGNASMVDQARRALGLDVLRFDSGDAESTGSLEVGRYVKDGVYVGARQSLDGKSSSVVVEVEVMNNVVIEGDVNQSAESGVGVTWRKDF